MCGSTICLRADYSTVEEASREYAIGMEKKLLLVPCLRGKEIYKNVTITEESNYYHTPVMEKSAKQKAERMHQYRGKPILVHIWPKHDI